MFSRRNPRMNRGRLSVGRSGLVVSEFLPAGYINARYLETISLIGTAVTTWASRGSSGTALNVTDGGSTPARPTYNAPGGFVSFDGVNSALASVGTLALNQPSTVALKVRIKTGAADGAGLCDGTVLNTRRVYSPTIATLSTGLFAGGPGFSLTGTYVLDGIYNIVCVFDGASSSITSPIRLPTFSGSAGASAANGWSFSSTTKAKMDLFAAAIFPRHLSPGEIAALLNAGIWI